MKFQTILLHDFYNTFFRKPQCWGQFCNYGNQIGQQIGGGYGGFGWGWGRKKRSAQFNNWGSQIGQQIGGGYGGYGYYGLGGFGGYGGGQFNNYGSQIGQQIGRRKKREAEPQMTMSMNTWPYAGLWNYASPWYWPYVQSGYSMNMGGFGGITTMNTGVPGGMTMNLGGPGGITMFGR